MISYNYWLIKFVHRQSNHNDNSNTETDDWLTEQNALAGNLYSYTFTNNMGHVDHKATYPADRSELNLPPLTELQSRYTVINGQHSNQHISQPPRTIYQPLNMNYQLPSTKFQPVNTFIQPAYTNIQPGNTNVPPANTNVPPANTNIQPASAYAQPTITYVQPVNAYVPPMNAYVQPANTYVQPAYTYGQPTNADASPSSTNYQPSTITSSQNQIPSSQNNTSMVERLQKLILNNGELDLRMIGLIALTKFLLINLKAFAFANLFLFILFKIKLIAFIVYLKGVVLLRGSKFFNKPTKSFINAFFK